MLRHLDAMHTSSRRGLAGPDAHSAVPGAGCELAAVGGPAAGPHDALVRLHNPLQQSKGPAGLQHGVCIHTRGECV